MLVGEDEERHGRVPINKNVDTGSKGSLLNPLVSGDLLDLSKAPQHLLRPALRRREPLENPPHVGVAARLVAIDELGHVRVVDDHHFLEGRHVPVNIRVDGRFERRHVTEVLDDGGDDIMSL